MKVFKLSSFNTKQRIGLLIAMVTFFIPFGSFLICLGFKDLIKLLSYPISLIYSFSPVLAAIGSASIFGPIVVLGIHSVVKGRQMQIHNQFIIFKIMIGGGVIAFLAAIAFDFFYLNQLEQRGYTACRGTPTGYTLGKATQYVLDPDLCEGKKRKAAKAGRR